MRNVSVLIIVVIFFLQLYAEIVNRNDIIIQAEGYANYVWTVNTVNPQYTLYSVTGTEITGVAYSYGDKDDTIKFQNDINIGLIPRNWKIATEDKPANPSEHYTGIDCSGLLTDCWNTNTYLLDAMISKCIKIKDSELEMGDALKGEGHVQIYAWNDSVYEALGWTRTDDTEHQMVRKSPKNDSYDCYSIFPQFSECTPKDGSTVAENDIEIGVTVRCKGEIYQAGTLIKVNNNEIKTFYIDKIDETTYRIGFTYERKDEETKCNVMVRTDNNISSLGNSYRDSIEWNFNVSNCIKELSVEPQTNKFTRKGEQRVFIFRFNWDPSAFKDDINVFLSSSTNEWQIGNIIGETGTVNLGNVENLILFKSLFYLHTIILVLIRNQNQLYFLKYSSISSRNSIPTCSKILSNF